MHTPLHDLNYFSLRLFTRAARSSSPLFQEGSAVRFAPGRDLVLCRLAGLDLERTGVIAGMSGSPVYIDGKLVGAVAYAWAYGKDPIAGITPFSQMHSFAESF